MPALLYFLALLALALIWLAIPLLPALWELYKKTDVAPLRVVREYDGNVLFFARGFESYISKQIAALPLETSPVIAQTNLPDGTPLLRVKNPETLPVVLQDQPDRTIKELVVVEAPVVLPVDVVFVTEVLARCEMKSSHGVVFRALLAEEDVRLGEYNTVLRWMHSHKRAFIGAHSTLYGRASSGDTLSLGAGCRFQRLNAPHLTFASQALPSPPTRLPSGAHWQPDNGREVAPRHFFVNGDIAVPAGSHFEGNLVATGHITVGKNALIQGNLKSHQQLTLENGSQVWGSVVSGSRIDLETGAFAAGPLIAEHFVLLGNETTVGTPDIPTTVSAPRIQVQAEACAHGTVWARELGTVGSH